MRKIRANDQSQGSIAVVLDEDGESARVDNHCHWTEGNIKKFEWKGRVLPKIYSAKWKPITAKRVSTGGPMPVADFIRCSEFFLSVYGRRQQMSKIFSNIANALKPGHGSHEEPETYEHDPIVQQHTKEHHEKHVTPVVEKDIDQPIIHRKVKPLDEHHDHASHVHTDAPAQDRVTFDERPRPAHTDGGWGIEPRDTDEALGTKTVVDQPIVHETIKHRHIDEVQPVVHRDVDHHTVEHVRQPVHETHHAAPIVDDKIGITHPFEA